MGLGRDSDRPELKIDVAPEEEGNFLLAEPSEQKRGKQLPLAFGGHLKRMPVPPRCTPTATAIFSRGDEAVGSGQVFHFACRTGQ